MKQLERSQNRTLVCLLLINLQLGLSYCWSIFSKALIDIEGWSFSAASLPNTAVAVTYSLSMLAFGFFQEKYGVKRTIRIGALLMMAGLAISAAFLTLPAVFIGYGILFGCGTGACFSATQALSLKVASDERQGSVAGLASAAFGVSSVLLSSVANLLIQKGGISLTFYVLAAVSGIVIFALASLIVTPPQAEESAHAAGNDRADRSMFKTRAFYCLLGMYVLSAAASSVPTGHITMIASLQGGLDNGYVFVSVLSVFSCVGRLLGGYLADRFSAKGVLLVSTAAALVNMLLFKTYSSFAAVICGSVVAGWHLGVIMALTPLLTSRLFGREHCARNYGVIAGFGLVNALLGSQLTGYLVDASHSYTGAYILCGAYLAAALIMTAILPKGGAVKEKAA